MKFSEVLVSPCCLAALISSKKHLACRKCGAEYKVEQGKPILILPQAKERFENFLAESEKQTFSFEKWPMIRRLFPPSETLRLVNKEEELAAKLGPEALILNIGSPKKKEGKRVVYLDADRSVKADIIADAHRLPFINESFELVICRFVLEHVLNPWKVVSEIHRVLKQGGIAYVDAPFLQIHHNSPADFHRFTLPGLKNLMSDFSEIERGMSVGPASALARMLKEFPGLFINNKLLFRLSKFVFGWLVFPLKYLDLVLAKRKQAYLLAGSFYFIGRKENKKSKKIKSWRVLRNSGRGE